LFFYKYNKIFAVLICFTLFLMTVMVPVSAEDTRKDSYLIMMPEDPKNAAENMMVGTLQERLTELGYYADRVTLILDAATRFALYNFCLSNGLSFDEAGVRQSTWDALMDENAIPAAGLAEYTFIPYGTVSDAVLTLQTRLKELQYYEGLILVPMVYDADLQTAVDRFCDENAVSYDRSGITAAVQELIYSNGAISYTAPVEQRSLAEKFSDYMMQDADLLVIVVPVFVVWILIMFLALIAAFFVLRLLQKRKAARELKADPQNKRGPRVDMRRKKMPPPLPKKQKMIQFQIDYQGKTWNIERDAFNPLTIGREVGDIRLDASDQKVNRKHCVLFFKGAILMLQDESDRGTYVNDSLFRKCVTPVQSGDCIVIGSHHIFLRF
jgi:hypothetical protein